MVPMNTRNIKENNNFTMFNVNLKGSYNISLLYIMQIIPNESTKITEEFAVSELEGPRQLEENSKEH